MRFEHDPDEETLFMEYKPYDENIFLPAGTLTREGS